MRKTLGTAEKVSPVIAKVQGGSTETEDPNLPTSPIPSSSVMESVLARVVEETSKTVDGTKSSLAQFGMLLERALAEANAQLAAQEGGSPSKAPSGDRGAERQGSEDVQTPGASGSESNSESGSEVLLDPV